MTAENPVSTQEFVNRMIIHKESRLNNLQDSLPYRIVDLVVQTQILTREALKLKPEDLVVILGEQTYGLNEPPKVIGKRLLAKGLQSQGAVPVELFASYDVVGSEGGIYRMQLPSPNSPDGFVSLNMLPGWKKSKNRSTAGFRSPTEDELHSTFASIKGLYGPVKGENLQMFMTKFYNGENNYSDANIQILRQFERQIGLEIENSTTEDVLDTRIAVNGGMEVMLYLWPIIVSEAIKHPTEGVRIPEIHETPFHLYHTDDHGCFGRMRSTFDTEMKSVGMETPVHSICMECHHEEITKPQEIIDTQRTLTWRAIPRVIAYSTIGIADGHITGGGSVYNQTAEHTGKNSGVSYFPLINMHKNGKVGGPVGIFDYESSALKIKGAKTNSNANNLVLEGRAAMTDLVLSIGVDQLKTAIQRTFEEGVTTHSRVVCPPPLEKNTTVIEI